MASQLTEFLEQRKNKAQGVDWQTKKKEWLDALSRLHARINGLLQQSTIKGIATVDEIPVQLTEDFVGTYEAPELRLTVGDDVVVFSPVGFHVFGAAGRVDLRGDRDVVSLIRLPEASVKDEWQFVLQRLPTRRLAPLNQRSLLDAFERVMIP
jgi:hypothetical protein